MYKILITCTLAAVALAAPEADADALYGTYGYGYYPALYNSYPSWPGYSAPGFSRTVFGLRGKRSADAEPEADAYYGGYYGGYGYPLAYRGYGYGGLYGYRGATSFVARSPQGLRGKRSADAEPEADADAAYAVAAYPYAYAPAVYNSYPNWPGVSTPYFSSTLWGARGKRSADAEPEADADAAYAVAAYPYAYAPAVYNSYPNWPGVSTPYFSSTLWGARGKRSADAEPEADADAAYAVAAYPYAYAPAVYNSYPNWPGVSTPYFSSTLWGARGKRSADAEPEADAYYGGYGYGRAYGYGHGYGYGYPLGYRGYGYGGLYGYGRGYYHG